MQDKLLHRRYIHALNHEKNCIKSAFKDIFETCYKWMKWQDIFVQLSYVSTRGGGQAVQGGLSCPPPRRQG